MPKKKRKNSNYQNKTPTKAESRINIVQYTKAKKPIYSLQHQMAARKDANKSTDEKLLSTAVDLCRKYPGLTIDAIVDSVDTITAAYQDELIKRYLRMSDEELFSYDCIDMSEVSKEEVKELEKSVYNKKDGLQLLYRIPCFPSGIILDPEGDILQYETLELNLETGHLVIKAEYFVKPSKSQPNKWPQYELNTSVVITIDKTENANNTISFDKQIEEADIMSWIPAEQLPWAQSDRDIWTNYTINIAKAATNQLKENTGLTNPQHTGLACVKFITAANILMERHRVTEKPTTATHSKTQAIAAETVDNKGRTIRHFGPVKLKSTEPPRTVTERIVEYKTPSWQVRGHMRHLKSGKIVHVNPTVRRRKKVDLSAGDTSIKSSTLKFKT